MPRSASFPTTVFSRFRAEASETDRLARTIELITGGSVALVGHEAEVSPAEAAKSLGVSRQYVNRPVANGRTGCPARSGEAGTGPT